MNKGLLFLAVGSIVIAAISFIKLSQQRKNKAVPKQQKSSKKKIKKQKRQQSQDQTNPVNEIIVRQHNQTPPEVSESAEQQDRTIYDGDVSEENPYKIKLKKPIYHPDIDKIQYNLLFSLNKSKGYQGVVKIKLISSKNAINTKNLYIDAIASSILYLSINSKKIQQNQIIFKDHEILIKKQWLAKYENNIEIIFANKYAFMGDGLTCYFPLDQFNKYSLKGQVIYVRNGFYKVPRIFPCLNILNPCQVFLEVLHPNGFNTESNNHKLQMKIATKKDYPNYQFFFYANNKSMNNSYRLNNSVLTQGNSFKSTDQIVKVKSQFSVAKLSSIHDFFLFCSAIVQIRPNSNMINLSSSVSSSQAIMKDVLIRYFTKQHLVKKATSFLNILESQIVQIFSKISDYKKTHKGFFKYQFKIDIFFVDDLKAEGDFYSGSILLNEKTIQRGVIDRRLYYLLCRAFVGMGMVMKKHQSLLSLEGTLKLNELTLQIFSQCAQFIYVKNKQYENIRNQTMRILSKKQNIRQSNKIVLTQEEQKQLDMEYWIVQYYEKQCRYMIRNIDKYQGNVSLNIRNIIEGLQKLQPEDYWPFFIGRYPFIQFTVSEVLIKLSLKYKGVPTGESDLKFAKENFVKSKYYIKFFTNKQIQSDLKKFIQLKTYGIQKILPFIKIKQSYLSSIPQNLQGYLYAKQNRLDSKKLYDQFKRYNQNNNFHHISALRRQIKRIKLLSRDHIEGVRKDIHCGLMGWKLLQKLKIEPLDQETYNLIQYLQKISGKEEKIKSQELNHLKAQEQAKKLQKLLQD